VNKRSMTIISREAIDDTLPGLREQLVSECGETIPSETILRDHAPSAEPRPVRETGADRPMRR
jgi:hypothetical protein